MTILWDSKCPSVRPAIVCYADILGFSAETRQAFASGTEDDFLTRIKRSLDKAYGIVREFNKGYFSSPPLFEMKVFTDNIVVAYPLDDPLRDEGEPELGAVMILFSEVQASLAFDGFFLRGAIAFGGHYQDDDVAYGDALLEAVGLDQSGGAPRLVIAPSVELLVALQLRAYGNGVGAPQFVELLEDSSDDRMFLNYMGSRLDQFPYFHMQSRLLSLHRDRLVIGLQEHNFNPRVRVKYEWLARYHNYVWRDFFNRLRLSGRPAAGSRHRVPVTGVSVVESFLVPEKSGLKPRLLDPVRLNQRVRSRLGRVS